MGNTCSPLAIWCANPATSGWAIILCRLKPPQQKQSIQSLAPSIDGTVHSTATKCYDVDALNVLSSITKSKTGGGEGKGKGKEKGQDSNPLPRGHPPPCLWQREMELLAWWKGVRETEILGNCEEGDKKETSWSREALKHVTPTPSPRKLELTPSSVGQMHQIFCVLFG